MDERVAAALRVLPGYLEQHVILSASALGLGLLISLPLVVAARRSARLRWARPDDCQPRADGAEPRFARALLSHPPGALGGMGEVLRAWFLRAWISTLAIGAHAVLDAADPAQWDLSTAQSRSGGARSGAGRRHDPAATVVARRTTARRAGSDGGHPHVGSVGDWYGDLIDSPSARRAWATTIFSGLQVEVGVRAVRMCGGRDPCACDRSIAGTHRARHRTSPIRRSGRRGRAATGWHRDRARAGARPRQTRLRHRREELHRAVHPLRPDAGTSARSGRLGRAA